MKNLFETSIQEEVVSRLQKLDEFAQPQWGKMTIGQMCVHCAAVLNTYGLKTPMTRPNFLVRLLTPWVRNTVLGKKAYQKNAATLPQWKQKEHTDFNEGMSRLNEALDHFTDPDRRTTILAWEHPLFGRLTEEESGWAMYKHLDHHLRQFGV